MELEQHFISFSSKDLAHVNEIVAGLERQGIHCWDYSDRSQRIAGGEAIAKHLRERIENCGLFLPLISSNSTDPELGRYVQLEVEHAVRIGKLDREEIVPIRLTDNASDQRPGALASLKGRMEISFALNDVRAHVNLMHDLCDRLGITYRPPPLAHHRLPFWEKFSEEAATVSHSTHAHRQLMTVLGEFCEHYKQGHLEPACALIEYFIGIWRHALPDQPMFYPWIVKAVCELELGRIDGAEHSFQQAHRARPTDPNAVGGLAHLARIRGDAERALALFTEAFDQAPESNDRMERYNMLVARCDMGMRLSPEEQQFLTHYDTTDLDTNERSRLLGAQAMMQYNEDAFAAALTSFQAMEAAGGKSGVSVLMQSRCLVHMDRVELAAQLLTEGIKTLKGRGTADITALYRELAWRWFQMGRHRNALQVYIEHLCPEGIVAAPELLIDQARMLKAIGDVQGVRACCERALDPEQRTGAKREKRYWMGFANHLLGREQIAAYELTQSGPFARPYDDAEEFLPV